MITIIGAGKVGGSAALHSAIKQLDDQILLLDIAEGLPQGEAMDLNHLLSEQGIDVEITGSNNYEDMKGSDIVVVVAGAGRKPGMTRMDLLKINAGVVKDVVGNIKKYATRTENLYGSGGMKTKIEAAKICQLSGCYMVIANGNHKNPIKEILENKKCTWFLPRISKLDARKQWIIGSVAPKGEVIIDDGALKAISNGKSLLPVGVKKINGTFEKGDHVLIKDQNNVECGRGLISFSSLEIEKIKGSHSSKIKNLLGYSSREEIIHKDDLVRV